jgi:hypothetical protein
MAFMAIYIRFVFAYRYDSPQEGERCQGCGQIEPTIAGIRSGRDEVLEEALRQILGTSVPSTVLENMAKP